MIRFDNLPPEVMQAMCTPMHLILPASPQQHTGALYLGSFSAILDPALLSANNIQALVQVLDAPWVPDPAARVTRVSLPLPRDFLVTPAPRALATRLTESATAST